MWGTPKPRTRRELLNVCRPKLTDASYQEVIKIATKYKSSITDDNPLDFAYAWCVIAEALALMLKNGVETPSYEAFKRCFTASAASLLFFQNALFDRGQMRWVGHADHEEYIDRVHEIPSEIHSAFDGHPELDRANTDAEKTISEAYRNAHEWANRW